MSLLERAGEFPPIAYLDIEEHFLESGGGWKIPFREEDREKFQDVVSLCSRAEEVHRVTKRMAETQGGSTVFMLSREYQDYNTALGAFEERSVERKMDKISAARRAFEYLAGKRTEYELDGDDIEAGIQLAGHLISNFRMRFPNQP